ncbi:MAG: hypothetical protein HY234_08650 [Acidobacteria bacterium]|nr:hypothetical protein [Acidobacteriota bacterium]MBI3663101.1 hypothetical protein [Acidobacteriota bacterium]
MLNDFHAAHKRRLTAGATGFAEGRFDTLLSGLLGAASKQGGAQEKQKEQTGVPANKGPNHAPRL